MPDRSRIRCASCHFTTTLSVSWATGGRCPACGRSIPDMAAIRRNGSQASARGSLAGSREGVPVMSASDAHERHMRAVENTFRLADQAAGRDDHADALAWLQVVEACGYPLPDEYAAKRQAWRAALAENGSVA
jgi:hypothetical protein